MSNNVKMKKIILSIILISNY
ncbi:lytic transglycosylase, partial [Escherichia coli]|nr:lytic transglycosylase [Escherichia coli]